MKWKWSLRLSTGQHSCLKGSLIARLGARQKLNASEKGKLVEFLYVPNPQNEANNRVYLDDGQLIPGMDELKKSCDRKKKCNLTLAMSPTCHSKRPFLLYLLDFLVTNWQRITAMVKRGVLQP